MVDSHLIGNQHLNRLRAAVLGANDGIVSTSSVVMGVAGAGVENHIIFTAGMAALVAGALSMALGEYVSVASQRDAEKAHIKEEHDGDDSHHEYTSPLQAGIASLLAFSAGGAVPVVAVLVAPSELKLTATVVAVIIALLITGYVSARFGKSSPGKAMFRIVIGGSLAMLLTYGIGTLLNVAT
ncbi:MAG TPA: VIT1/CCC1 transporter family protein [Candidatus Saccharimonadales bacterium]